jgi:hypothetical protein
VREDTAFWLRRRRKRRRGKDKDANFVEEREG